MVTNIVVISAVIALVGLIIAICNLRVVPQSRAWVMERLGVYSRTWNTGLHIKIPFIEKKAMAIDLREQMLVLGEGIEYNHNHYHNHGKSKRAKMYAYTDDYIYKSAEDVRVGNDASNNSATGGAVVGTGKVSTVIGGVRLGGAVGAGGATGSSSSQNAYNKYVDEFAVSEAQTGYRASYIHGNAHHHGFHSPKSQPVITKDNVSMEIDTVVFYMVTDPKLFAYGHANPISAIRHLTATTLRNLVGELELDSVLTSREFINNRMRTILDEATDAWGVKITRVELINLIISDIELSEAMEKQMIAERRRREQIILAEGERKSAILVAEGQKQAKILAAEGEKQAQILAAEAKREAMICEAEGEAEAILQVQQATAEGIKMVNASEPSQAVLTIKSLEAFQKAADGQATKIIIPSEIQGLAGLASSASEIFKAE